MSARRRSVLIATALLAVSIALALVVAANMLTDRLPTRTLRDGTTVTLKAVSFGQQEVVRGAWWRKLIYFCLPARLRERAGCQVYRGPGGKALTVYLRVRGPAVARSHDSQGFTSAFGEMHLANEHGIQSGAGDFMSGADEQFSDFDGEGNESVRFRALPRTGKMLRLNIGMNVPPHGATASFTFPNPDPGPHPSWVALPLPQTQSEGDVAVTLTRFEARPKPTEPGFPASAWVRACWKVSKGGAPAPEWGVWPVGFSSPTGNEWGMVGNSEVGFRPEGERCIGFGSEKWLDDPVWKMRVEVSPYRRWPDLNRRAQWSPEEVWTVPNVAVPADGKTVPLHWRRRVEGVDVELVAIGGKDRPLPGEYRVGTPNEFPVPRILVRADASAQSRACDVFVFARDRAGKLFEVPGTIDLNSEPETSNSPGFFWLDEPAHTTTVDLLVVVQRHRFVEFVVANPFLHVGPTSARH